MTVALTCAMMDGTISCPLVSAMFVLIDEVHALSNEIKEIHRILETKEEKRETSTKKPSNTAVPRQHVNEKVMTLQLKNPDRVWTSEDFAEEIGCSGAAVRQTEAWKAYCMMQAKEQQSRRPRKGYKNRQGDIEACSD